MNTAFQKTYVGRNVMITGGLGFIGSNLARRLVRIGANVTIVDSMIPDYGGNFFNIDDFKDDVVVNVSDVRDRSSMDHLVKGRDFIFNLAGQVSHIDSMNDPFTDLEINCRSQLSILESCRHNNRDLKIVFAGSRQQYGRPQYLPVDEKHPILPVDINGVNKVAGEWYHILYNDVYGIRASSLRLTNTYGPGQLMKHNRQGFIGWFVRLVTEGKEIQLFGDGKQVRDFNYVEDVVDAFLAVGAADEATGKIYNLAGSEPTSLLDLVQLMIKIAGRASYKLVPFPPEKKRIDIGSYYGTFKKIESEIGWTPRTTLAEGLAKTFDYYKAHIEKYVS